MGIGAIPNAVLARLMGSLPGTSVSTPEMFADGVLPLRICIPGVINAAKPKTDRADGLDEPSDGFRKNLRLSAATSGITDDGRGLR